MNTANIQQEIFKLLKTYEGRSANQSPVTLSSKLSEDLDIDSARLVDIVLDVEAKFGISIDDANLPNLKTVGELVSLVEGLVKATKDT
jgi:acyl carrier protein